MWNSHTPVGRISDGLEVERVVKPCADDVLCHLIGSAEGRRDSDGKSEKERMGAAHILLKRGRMKRKDDARHIN
jgi:hypothetical protein